MPIGLMDQPFEQWRALRLDLFRVDELQLAFVTDLQLSKTTLRIGRISNLYCI